MALLVAAGSRPSEARHAPVTVLVSTSVAPDATALITPAAWKDIVAAYVNADRTVDVPGEMTAAACRAQQGLYMVSAAFLTRGDLAHSTLAEGKLAARAHVVAVNCISGATVFDRTLDLQSGGPSDEGDLEATAEGTWRGAVRQLARSPLPLTLVARITRVQSPVAYINFGDISPRTDIDYRVFAHADGTPATPVVLHPVDADRAILTVTFSSLAGDPLPQAGDYVEPLPPEPTARPGTRP